MQARHSSKDRPLVADFVQANVSAMARGFGWRVVRLAAASSVGRAVVVFVGLLAAAFLLIPAAFTALLIWLVTGDSQAGGTGFMVVFGLAALVLVIGALAIWQRWRGFKRRYR